MSPLAITHHDPCLEPYDVLGDRYRVSALIGRGGMGEVYEAHDLKEDRPVAVKVMAGLCTPVLLERFRREAELGMAVDHPNVGRVLDVDTWSTPPFMVMELLEGLTLEDQIAEQPGPRSLEEVVELLEPIAHAIDAIHAKGFLHRDVKPANILLASEPDGTPRPMLIDFGVAAAHDSSWERLTVDGTLVGTPIYVPPESADLDEALGPQYDVYSLAVVAFLLYTGHLPFPGTDEGAILRRKMTLPARRPSWFRADATKLDALFAHALSRRPKNRPTSAVKFIEGLREKIDRRAAPPTLDLYADKPNRGSALRGAGAAMMAIAAMIVGAAQLLPPPQTASALERSTASVLPPPALPHPVHRRMEADYRYDIEPIPLARTAEG